MPSEEYVSDLNTVRTTCPSTSQLMYSSCQSSCCQRCQTIDTYGESVEVAGHVLVHVNGYPFCCRIVGDACYELLCRARCMKTDQDTSSSSAPRSSRLHRRIPGYQSQHSLHHTVCNTNPIDLILAYELDCAARRPELTLTSDMVMAAVMTPGHFDVSAMSAAPSRSFSPPPHAGQSRSCRIGCIVSTRSLYRLRSATTKSVKALRALLSCFSSSRVPTSVAITSPLLTIVSRAKL